MEQIRGYRSIVKRILSEHAEQMPSHGKVETVPLFDESHDQYAVLDLGWDRLGRVHAVILHIRLLNGKVWIEQDGTEEGVAEELLKAGIPKEDIVLGFYRPERRAITEFAVA
ncbi:MAG: XisI protein [Chloroflexi bacterium]|nr:XisI protein [Chloroflexota bacterium]